MIGNVIKDLQYSLRMLVKSPLFAVIAITTLALGIGLNAATFSAIHGLLLRPLGGVADPEELLQVYRQWPGIDYGSNSIPHYQDVRDRSGKVFESTAAWFFAPMSLSTEGRSERILGIVASANLFQTYGRLRSSCTSRRASGAKANIIDVEKTLRFIRVLNEEGVNLVAGTDGNTSIAVPGSSLHRGAESLRESRPDALPGPSHRHRQRGAARRPVRHAGHDRRWQDREPDSGRGRPTRLLSEPIRRCSNPQPATPSPTLRCRTYQRFLLIKLAEEDNARPLTLVVNWTAELER